MLSSIDWHPHEDALLLDDKARRDELVRYTEHSMGDVLEQKVAVVGLLGRSVHQGRSIPQAKTAHPLLDEVKVLIAVFVLLLQRWHHIRLKTRQVEARH